MKIAVFITLFTISSNVLCEKTYTTDPKWKIVNKLIDFESVCYNYKKGSIKYRECRNHAASIFKERCRKTKSEKFCHANYHFKPVN